MRQILGIDVGGTKIAAGLVDQNHKVSKVRVVPTSQSDLLSQLIKLIESYSDYSAIGLGMPGIISAKGMIKKLPNIKDFKPINLKEYLKTEFQVPVNVMNDSEAFALAEARVGSGQKFKRVFGVILGTGIGGGFVVANTSKNTELILRRKLPGLETKMQKFGPFKKAYESNPFVNKLLPVIMKTFRPDVIIFGGARSKLPGMQSILNKYSSKLPLKVSKLKHAGIIGAALPGLKK